METSDSRELLWQLKSEEFAACPVIAAAPLGDTFLTVYN